MKIRALVLASVLSVTSLASVAPYAVAQPDSVEANSKALADRIAARMPLKFDGGGRVEVGGRKRSFWGKAKGQMSANGRVDFIQSIDSKEALAGFTGYTILIFRDGQGNIIYMHRSPSRGVNGTALPGPSAKQDAFTIQVGPEIVALTAQIDVLAMHAPRSWHGQVAEAREVLGAANKLAADAGTTWAAVSGKLGK